MQKCYKIFSWEGIFSFPSRFNTLTAYLPAQGSKMRVLERGKSTV